MRTHNKLKIKRPGLENGSHGLEPWGLEKHHPINTAIEAYRRKLQEFHASQEVNEHQDRMVIHVLREAEALAWQSGVPHLVFPTLAEEKLRKASEWAKKQEAILKQTVEQSFAM